MLDPVFDLAEPFVNGVARVVVNGKPQWIDSKGLPTTAPTSTNPKKKMGYEVIMKNNKYGVASTMKEVLIKPQYDEIKHGIRLPDGEPDYSKKLFLVKTGKGWGIVNKEGEEIIPAEHTECKPFQFGFCIALKDNKWGVYNMKGKQVIAFKYDKMSMGNEGMFLAMKKITKDSSAYGYFNAEGKALTEMKYKEAEDFYYGMAAVYKDSAWGYIGAEGKEITEFKFQVPGPFLLDSGKYAVVSLNKKYGIIDRDGQYIIFPSYKAIAGYSYGLFRVQDTLDNWGFINPSGQALIPIQYEQVSAPKEGYITYKTEGKWGILDTAGAPVVAPNYEGEIKIVGGGLFSVHDLGGDLIGYISFYGTEYWFKEGEN